MSMNPLFANKWGPRMRILSMSAIVVGMFFHGPEATAASGLEKIRTIEGVTEYRLANGLQVLLYPDASSNTATVNITYKVGSRFESYGETGMAHLLEHLSFKGTPDHPNIYGEMSSHGARANATTAEDRTNYFETFPATEANVEWALGLEADRMVHSFIAKKDLDTEMTVVRNEFEKGETSPIRILRERVLESAYLWHNYGHPTIGARADIENVPIERLQNFYHAYYQPDNAVLIVAGKFNEAETLSFIQRTYGAIPKPTRVLPSFYTEEPTQDGEREVTLRRTGGEKVLIESYHIPADAHADSAALGALAAMLNESPSGRLYQRLIETKLATQVNVGAAGMHDAGYLMFIVTLPKEGDLAKVREVLDQVIAGVASQPFSEAELKRIQMQRRSRDEILLSQPASVAGALSESVAVGDWRLLFWDQDQLQKVTLSDVERVAAAYLVSSNLTVGAFIPEERSIRAAIPQTLALDAMLEGYSGSKEMQAGEDFDRTPANIEARTQRSTIGSLKTAFLEKKTRGDRVSAVINLRFGDAQSLQHRSMVGIFTLEMLMRGTEKHTRQQIQDELTRLDATVKVSGATNAATLMLSSTRKNLPQLLRLAAEILKQPAFPANDLEEIKRSELSEIDIALTDPEKLARKAERRYLSPYGPDDFRYVLSFEEEAAAVAKLSVADLEQFHRQFYGASHGEVAVVGSFDRAAVTQVLKESFGSWKSASPYERVPAVYKAVSGKLETIETPDKANATYRAGGTLNLSDDDPSYPALEVGNFILGGGFLNSRLAVRIRQHDGLSYSITSGLQVSSEDPVGFFSVFAICAPQNIGTVGKDVREEITRAEQAGFTPQEIDAAKSGILQSRLVGRANDTALAAILAEHLYLGRTYAWDANIERKIKGATPEAVQTAMRRYIDIGTLYTVEAGDFAKPGAGLGSTPSQTGVGVTTTSPAVDHATDP
jgi:zinc protease